MGHLVDGVWHTGWYPPDASGAFRRPKTVFHDRVERAEVGRYHLYVARACPWAHRVMITRSLLGLTDVIGITHADPHMGDDGWQFTAAEPDPLGGSHLRDVYLRADARYTGRVTVPILWDRQRGTIVCNESREIMRMLSVDFAALGRGGHMATLAPEQLRGEIDAVLDDIYEPINNGVYRAGFAATQAAYDEAVHELFAALGRHDARLSSRPFTCGDELTEADIALFTTLVRFDLVYHAHFKCNLRRLRDHHNLWRFTRQLYQHPAITPTVALDEIKTHYYWSQTTVNPTRIVPAGPADYEQALRAPL